MIMMLLLMLVVISLGIGAVIWLPLASIYRSCVDIFVQEAPERPMQA